MKKLILIISLILLVLGIAVICISLALGGAKNDFAEVTYNIDEGFDKIEIETGSADILIKASEDGSAYAVCDEDSKIIFSVGVENRTLKIEEKVKSWLAFAGISFGARRCTVYLPAREYSSLELESGSGRIECTGSDISFIDAELETGSGAIFMSSPVKSLLSCSSGSGRIETADIYASRISLSTGSGRIELKNSERSKDLVVKSASGAIQLDKCRAEDITISSSSGRVDLNGVIASGKLKANTSSGSIKLSGCDGGDIVLASGSGRISGTILTDKLFDVSTGSGNIDCPPSIRDGGKCEISTGSGDIDIRIE